MLKLFLSIAVALLSVIFVGVGINALAPGYGDFFIGIMVTIGFGYWLANALEL